MIILFQGDSITDGNRYKDEASRWDLNHQIGHGYPYVIAAELGSLYPERGYRFINRGVSGDGIAKMFGRWRADAVLLKPDVVSVLIGINDQSPAGCGPDLYGRLYHMLPEDMNGARFVIMEPFMLSVGQMAEGFDERMDRLKLYQAAALETARDIGAVFVPLQDAFFAAAKRAEPAYWIWDGVHPTEAGHGLIAREWMRMTGDILK